MTQLYQRLAALAVTTLFLPLFLSAQVQTFQEVIGHEWGERITKSHQIEAYLTYLDEASDRFTMFEIGTTYNQKRQVGGILTSPENHARIDEIKRNGQRLDDPRTLPENEATNIIENQPAILYLAGSIHGFELSGTEGVLKLIEHFTTSNDPETLEQLANTVMVVDPNINADGRDAFAQTNHQLLGRTVVADNDDWSNDFNGWEARKYRTSHYYFDLNRDWFAHTHNETRNRAAILREWRPQAGVDAHEMGANTEFYVDPPADPVSPLFPEYASKWFVEYGRAHAETFDEHHVEYTKGELFNFFYPAYFTSYMTHQGAVGMLYEQGSSRGFGLQMSDGTVRTLADAANQQYLALRAMVGMSADRRAEMLRDYYNANLRAIEAGRSGTVRYFIEQAGDPNLVAEAVNLLMRSGVEVHRLDQETSVRGVINREGSSIGNHTFAAGTYVIEAAQPRNSFLRNMLDPEVPMPSAFLEEARKRVDRGENPRFYDITSWSLPLLYNLQGFSTGDSRSLSATRVEGAVVPPTSESIPPARYAYLIDGSQAKALSAIPYLREQDIRVSVLFKPTQVNQKAYTSGTVVVRTDGNTESVRRAVTELAQRFHLTVDAVHSGMADPGFPSLGSVEGSRISKPEIALIGDHPFDAYSFGWAWHTLDRVYEVPHLVMKARSLGSTKLERFNVIVLPEVNGSQLSNMLGSAGVERLQRWVRDGGTLVAIGSATDFVRNDLELLELESWYDADENKNAQRVTVPGAFFAADVDDENWLTSGYDFAPPVLVNTSRLYTAPDGAPTPRRNTPLTIRQEDGKISGHAWEENLERLPGTVFLYEERVGSGRVIAFADDPNFRGYWRGANRLFLNAVILGPSGN
ncbi:MAG: M14 family zinc carboxypeptidase [Balneolaceae bacterium]